MQRKYLHFSFLLIFILTLRICFNQLQITSAQTPITSQLDNAEALLAKGKKINLCTCNAYDLQLISGISEVLSDNILSKQHDIIKRSHTLPRKTSFKSLEIVHGIGTAKALKFNEFIDTNCNFSIN